MKIWFKVLLIGWASGFVPGIAAEARAEPLASVQRLQQPTWVERAGVRLPVYPAMGLLGGDHLVTSETGKLLLRFADGSDVEIGNSASIHLRQLSMEAEEKMVSADDPGSAESSAEGLFRGVLGVLKGAFRFTTTAAGLGRQRAIDISVGEMATIGIRGTDVWGKADPKGDFVVLIEGEISVDRQGAPTLTMADPQTIYKVPAGAVDGEVNSVSPADLQRWAEETRLDYGGGVVAGDGPFVVNLASMERVDYATSLLADFQRKGYAVSIDDVDVSGVRWQRLQVVGFLTATDASAFNQSIRQKFPAIQPWVIRRP